MSSLVTPARGKYALLGLLIAPSCPASSRTTFGSATALPQDLVEVEADRLLELGVRAGARLAVRAPADELGGVPEPRALRVVVADLEHPLRAQRDEREVLVRAPPAGHRRPQRPLARLLSGPFPPQLAAG